VLFIQFVSWRILLPSRDDCILSTSRTALNPTDIYALLQALMRRIFSAKENNRTH